MKYLSHLINKFGVVDIMLSCCNIDPAYPKLKIERE